MSTDQIFKRLFLIILVLFICSFIYGEQADFFTQLSEKEYATFSDCVVSYCYFRNIQVTDNFDKNVMALQEQITKMPKNLSEDKSLTVGDFSMLTAQHLNIKSGLFYLASKAGRYASRELFQLNIIPLNTSEFEKISGLELIQLLQKVVEYEEKKVNK